MHPQTPARRTQWRGIAVIAALFLAGAAYFAITDSSGVDTVEITNRAFDDAWQDMTPDERQDLCDRYHDSDGAIVDRTANTIAREHDLTGDERDQVHATFTTRYTEAC